MSGAHRTSQRQFDRYAPVTASSGPGYPLVRAPGLRYCETCRLHKPRGKQPAMKGWKCEDCRA